MTYTSNITDNMRSQTALQADGNTVVSAQLYGGYPAYRVVYFPYSSGIAPEYLTLNAGIACGYRQGWNASAHELLTDASTIHKHLNFKKMAKPKKVLTAERIKTDSAFERTRENNAEFSRCIEASRITRDAFRALLINAADNAVAQRLTKAFYRVVATDPVSDRGERTVNNGQIEQLKGFNFNKKSSLRETLFVKYTTTVDRATGNVAVAIPAFVPRVMVLAAGGATHFRITAIATAIDFDNDIHEYDMKSTEELIWDKNPTAAINLSLSLTANSPYHIVIALAIEFFQKVNSKLYALKSSDFNAAAIVKVVPKP
jgi:hypothetical protein